MENQYKPHLREIKGNEMKKWKPQKQGDAIGIIEAFLNSKMEMAEVDLDMLPKPEQKAGSKMKSTKQDSFASSFYAWKKKDIIQERLVHLEIDILLIRRGGKVALKKAGRKR